MSAEMTVIYTTGGHKQQQRPLTCAALILGSGLSRLIAALKNLHPYCASHTAATVGATAVCPLKPCWTRQTC